MIFATRDVSRKKRAVVIGSVRFNEHSFWRLLRLPGVIIVGPGKAYWKVIGCILATDYTVMICL